MTIGTIGLYGNPQKPRLGEILGGVIDLCRTSGVEVLLADKMADLNPEGMPLVDDQALVSRADMLVVFGGDGTMLRAARIVGESGTPMLGVNMGSLGYLTDVPLNECEDSITQILAGDYAIAKRDRVACTAKRGGETIFSTRALNDIVVNMGPMPRAMLLEVKIDSASMGKYLGDGLIVSTPTGSTAYNLSAGGPIVHPGVNGLIVTPICPHSLAVRPLVIPADRKVRLRLLDVGEGATLNADGQQAFSMQTGDTIDFLTDTHPVHLIKLPRGDYFRVMRRKLRWGATSRRSRTRE